MSNDSQRLAMTFRQIVLMNFGFFGIQYSFGLQQTAINPIFSFLKASPEELPLLNLALICSRVPMSILYNKICFLWDSA